MFEAEFTPSAIQNRILDLVNQGGAKTGKLFFTMVDGSKIAGNYTVSDEDGFPHISYTPSIVGKVVNLSNAISVRIT